MARQLGRKTTPASVVRAKPSTTTTASSSPPTPNCPANGRNHTVDRQAFLRRNSYLHTAKFPISQHHQRQGALASSQDKVKYEGQLGQAGRHRPATIISSMFTWVSALRPYVALDPLKAALPVHRPTMTMLLSHDNCEGDKHDACYVWTQNSLHPEHAGDGGTTPPRNVPRSFHQTASNQGPVRQTELPKNTLTSQLEYLQGWNRRRRWNNSRIAYTSRKVEPTATIIKDNYSVFDHKLFQTVCQSDSKKPITSLPSINSNALAPQPRRRSIPPRGLYKCKRLPQARLEAAHPVLRLQ